MQLDLLVHQKRRVLKSRIWSPMTLELFRIFLSQSYMVHIIWTIDYGKHRRNNSRVIKNQIREFPILRFWCRSRCKNQIWAIFDDSREKNPLNYRIKSDLTNDYLQKLCKNFRERKKCRKWEAIRKGEVGFSLLDANFGRLRKEPWIQNLAKGKHGGWVIFVLL